MSDGLLAELADWAAALRLDDVPDRVVAVATSQVVSQLAAIRAGLSHPLGARLVAAFGEPLQADPASSAAVLAGLGSWLNLDDTAYAGHLGPSTVAVPLAYARALGLDGRAFLAAVIAAGECAARVTAAATLGRFRGQTAMYTHLVGGVAGRLHCAGAPGRLWTDALALALSSPPWPVLRGFIGSDAKVLNAVTPVRLAMDGCAAAEAGIGGAADVLEHEDGFLAAFADVPIPDVVTHGLGTRWHTETLSFKVRPGGPGIDAAVDCAIDLAREAGPFTDIAGVEVEASWYTLLVDRHAVRYSAGADTPVSALLLLTPYAVATALLTGDLTVADFAEPALRDARRWALADRVTMTHDTAMTGSLLASCAPFGEALRHAGPRAAKWLERFGTTDAGADGPADTFATAVKATPARVTVRLGDGRTVTRERSIPIGAAGPDTRARHAALVRGKFVAHGGRPDVADALARLVDLDAAELAAVLSAALGDTGC